MTRVGVRTSGMDTSGSDPVSMGARLVTMRESSATFSFRLRMRSESPAFCLRGNVSTVPVEVICAFTIKNVHHNCAVYNHFVLKSEQTSTGW